MPLTELLNKNIKPSLDIPDKIMSKASVAVSRTKNESELQGATPSPLPHTPLLFLTRFKFSNLCGTVYRQGNVLFTADGNTLLSPVGNRVSVFDLVKCAHV